MNLEKFYNKHIDRIYKFFYLKTFNKELSEDLTSSVFLAFAEVLSSGEAQIEDPDKFIYGIARNKFLEYLKSKYSNENKNINYIDDIEVEPFLENYEETQTVEEKLKIFLPNIPKSQARVLKLRFIDKHSLKTICKMLEKDMNYVKVTQNRGLKSLKKLFNISVEKEGKV